VRRGTWKRARWWVVDVGFETVSWACCLRGREGGLELEAWGTELLDGAAESEAEWWGEVAAALRKLGEKARGEAVRLGIPGHVALTKWVRIPAVAVTKRAKVVEFEAAQNIPYPLEDVVWDYVVVAENGAELELMLAAAKTEVIERLCAAVEDAGMKVVQVTPACVELWHCMRWNHPEAAAEGALLVESGERSTQLVFAQGERFYVRTLNQVAAAGDMPARLQAEVARTMANARRQGLVLEPRVILLGAGRGASASGTGGWTDLRVEQFEPLRRVRLAVRPQEETGGIAEKVAGVVGLAVAANAGATKPNLLPRNFRRAATAGRWRRVVGVAAMLGVSALVVAIWQLRGAREAMETRFVAIEAELEPLRARERRVIGMREELERLDGVERRLRRVVDARTAWVRFFAEMQEVLRGVEDVWLERVAIEEGDRGKRDERAELRLTVSGGMIDPEQPTAGSYEKVRQLLEGLEAARSVAAVEHPRFDKSRAGILGFDVTLVMDARWRGAVSEEMER